MLRLHNQKTGFTLIELLVVITIIAILVAILFPVFAKAKGKAYQISCLSNVKQLALAFLMYASDYDGRMPFAYEMAADWSWTSAWDYYSEGWPPTYQLGLIGAYTNNEQINACPIAQGLESWGRPYSGYAYNASYVGGSPDEGRTPATFGDIARPTETVLLCDSAYWNVPFGGGKAFVASTNYLRAPGDPFRITWGIGPNVHFRHNGTANVAYCDGHAEIVTQKFNVSPNDESLADLSEDDSAYDLE